VESAGDETGVSGGDDTADAALVGGDTMSISDLEASGGMRSDDDVSMQGVSGDEDREQKDEEEEEEEEEEDADMGDT
jgi:hypothetical protein